MCFYSLSNRTLTDDEQTYYMRNYLFPGIFQFLFGFLEKLNTKKLKQTPEFTEPIVIDDEEIFPKIGFKNVCCI